MTAGSPLTPEAVRDALRQVKYPGFSRDIVSFGIVKDLEAAAGMVRLRLPPRFGWEGVALRVRRQDHS